MTDAQTHVRTEKQFQSFSDVLT